MPVSFDFDEMALKNLNASDSANLIIKNGINRIKLWRMSATFFFTLLTEMHLNNSMYTFKIDK